jgi:hypothetical protein
MGTTDDDAAHARFSSILWTENDQVGGSFNIINSGGFGPRFLVKPNEEAFEFRFRMASRSVQRGVYNHLLFSFNLPLVIIQA